MLQTLTRWNQELGPFDHHTRLVTIDVQALYTNIPHKQLETAILHFLNRHKLSNTPPVETVLQVTNHVLTNNVFTFRRPILQTSNGNRDGNTDGSECSLSLHGLARGTTPDHCTDPCTNHHMEKVYRRHLPPVDSI